MRGPPVQTVLPKDNFVGMDKVSTLRTKFLRIAKEGVYKVTFSFNGLPCQPKEVRLFLEEAERKMNLIREGIMVSKTGVNFITLILDRQTLQNFYILLLKYGAQVKIEKTSYFSSRKLGELVWRAVYAPS
ncbi:MAG: hypothetical protein QXX87_01505 [Candidatus Jordarchaeales archaeon]